ncbi:hypothetical protein VTK73DRAFT_8356 [Phialemonium thermophilum]|uniref:Restriction endonuclease type IV Mrr domain-containing protein n=1 Tax=Phialemonium thermophilum TaxID=223376 RepID=A0ABR3Y7C1_9PEZI
MSRVGRCILTHARHSDRLAIANLNIIRFRATHSASPALNESLVYPSPTSPHHNDLPSFLRYAERSRLDPKSPTYIGTHFEYVVGSSLSRLGFSLRRVGGSSDCGIDLLGVWSVPSSDRPLKVLVQCKSIRRPGPHLVRELEGAFVGAPPGWRGPCVLGLLVTDQPATKGIRDAIGRSRWPMGFVTCTRSGHLQQMLWNRRAEEEGLEGMGVGLRHAADGAEKQLVLSWKGSYVPWVEERSRQPG